MSSPRAASSTSTAKVRTPRESGIEQFRFRNAAAATSAPSRADTSVGTPTASSAVSAAPPVRAYSRLYAQAVDLREHKDSVFRQYGLLKSPRERSSTSTTASTATAAANSTSLKTQSAPSLQRAAAASHKRSVTRAVSPSPSKRNGATPYPSDRHVLPTNAAFARTFSLQSTVASRQLVSPKGKPLATRRATAPTTNTWSAPLRQTRSYAQINSSRQQSQSQVQKSGNHSARRTPQTAAVVDSSRKRSSTIGASGGTIGTSVSTNGTTLHSARHKTPIGRYTTANSQQQMRTDRSSNGSTRRQATARPAATGTAHVHSNTGDRKRQAVRMGVPTTFVAGTSSADTTSTSAPVLIQVSRRTSSSIATPSSAAFGMRRRPSVSPIPSIDASDISTNDTNTSTNSIAPQPRASLLVRRDSKMERLVEQITVLKASLGLSDEDVQWKVESTKGNAFLAAERHLSDSEERYDRLVYELQLLTQTLCEDVATALVARVRDVKAAASAVAERKPQLAACQSDVAQRNKELLDAAISAELDVANVGTKLANVCDTSISSDTSIKRDIIVSQDNDVAAENAQLMQLAEAKARILHVQEQLRADVSRLNDNVLALVRDTDTLAHTCATYEFLSPDAAVVSSQLVDLLQHIPACSAGDKLVALCEQAIAAAQTLRSSRLRDVARKETELAHTAAAIEVWKTRRETAKEYAVELAKRELAWRTEHSVDNAAALALVRQYVPIDVQQLSIDAIIARAAALGVLIPFDLATYIKQNRFLHWLVTHESDVARANFLAVETASWFTNFGTYDIHELRALAAVLPLPNAVTGASGFDFDKDGRKAAWRQQFMDHVFATVKQQRGECVRAGWDSVKQTRGDVPLPPLSARQLLNPIFRYATDTEVSARITKLEYQRERLNAKRAQLQVLENERIPAARAEYVAIADDARCDAHQQAFGKATLIALRDAAKQTLVTLTKTRDALVSETQHAERQWLALSPTYEQIVAEAAAVQALDTATRAARITGPFPSDVTLAPRAAAAFKKLSVEEEAEARRRELDSAIASRGKEMSDAAEAAAANVAAESLLPADSSSISRSGTDTPCDTDISQDTNGINGTVESAGDSSAESVQPTGNNSSSADGTAHSEETATAAAAADASSHTSIRRIKSLQVSAEVLQFLQHDFCNTQRVHALAARHGSSSSSMGGGGHSTAKAVVAVAAAVRIKRFASEHSIDVRSASDVVPKVPESTVPVRPKSKALLDLLDKQSAIGTDSNNTNSAKPPPVAMNMFSELQSRFAAKAAASSSDDVASVSVSAAPKKAAAMSFLDELKHRATRKLPTADVAPLSPMSISNSSVAPLPPPPPVPTSFLAELRARSRSVD